MSPIGSVINAQWDKGTLKHKQRTSTKTQNLTWYRLSIEAHAKAVRSCFSWLKIHPELGIALTLNIVRHIAAIHRDNNLQITSSSLTCIDCWRSIQMLVWRVFRKTFKYLNSSIIILANRMLRLFPPYQPLMDQTLALLYNFLDQGKGLDSHPSKV